MKQVTLILVLLLTALSASAESKDNTKSATPGASEAIDEKASDAKTCAKKMERFYKSQDCLATHKNKDGSMKPDAIKNCGDIKYPSECQYSS